MLRRVIAAIAIVASAALAQVPRKKLLAIGEVKGWQHDSVSHALATIERLGKESGLWDTYIRTDTELITRRKLERNARNIDFFDAILFYTTGELPMNDEQKTALMTAIRDQGKGFIGVHSATDTFYDWPEFGEMIGGYFDQHPWNTFNAPVIVEEQSHPATRHFPKDFVILDEIYQFKNWSRDKVRVLMRLDESKLDLNNKRVKRADHDFAVTWVKNYGKGRVFYSSLGHRDEVWDRPDVQKMYLEAIKWAMGLTQGETSPRPRSD
ncbi:MAG: ThuA domain-containing protein [Acidobacteria bacterium]|nr:ThuA domain-containing protein [Acidobacteriota bacterium]